MNILKYIMVISVIFLLTGCWDSIELNEAIMVVGVGVSKDKERDHYHVVLEAISPAEEGATSGEVQHESVLLEITTKSLTDASRELISIAKRRLFFTHTDIWVIHDEIAKEDDMLIFLDILRRENMIRLNSHLFISDVMPKEIFTTDNIFSDILSEELISSIEYAKYVSSYPSGKTREFMRNMLGPFNNGVLPTITTFKDDGKILSKLTGAAVFKEGKMVGELNEEDTFGLLWMNKEAEGGTITISNDEIGGNASLKLKKSHIKLETDLQGENLLVHIHAKAIGTLADQQLEVSSIEEWSKTFSKKISEKIKSDIESTLYKLQKEYKTDVTNIGRQTYRQQVDEFNKVRDEWGDVFSNAKIVIEVETIIKSKGLINKPGYQPPEKNDQKVYQFKRIK